MPKKVEWYRLNAERCQQLAKTSHDPEAKRAMAAMADSWLLLATQRDKNLERRVRSVAPSEPNPK